MKKTPGTIQQDKENDPTVDFIRDIELAGETDSGSVIASSDGQLINELRESARQPSTTSSGFLPKMRYRSRLEIASNILEIARSGNATKTRLMYGSFLSFAQINEYVPFLLANNLIMKDEATRVYSLTEKGMRFLQIYGDLTTLIPLDKAIPAV
jgi:predicted transcriptional regulator